MDRQKQRKRLMEILNTKIYPSENADPTEAVADFLLDRGVIVPPVSVGTQVYFVLSDDEEYFASEPLTVTEVGSRGFWTSGLPHEKPDAMHDFTPWQEFGEGVYLSETEAREAAHALAAWNEREKGAMKHE